MTYESPQLIDTEKKFIATVPTNFDYADPITNVIMNRKASSLFISEGELKPIDGHSITMTVDTNIPTTQQKMDFIGIQGLIKICTDNAEDIKNKFLEINLNIPLTEKERRDKLNLLSLGFMKLKERFIEFVKKDELIKTTEKYSSNEKMKPFIRTLNMFVLDRNIYTHGQLHFLRPNFNFAIEYIDSKINRVQYAMVDFETLKSYNEFYKEINDFVDTFRETRNHVGS